MERIKADSKWLRAFYKHSLDDSDKTVEMINDVLKWRQDFDCNGKTKTKIYFQKNLIFKGLLIPGKLPVPEELFKKGALFKRNEDIRCNPLRRLIN